MKTGEQRPNGKIGEVERIKWYELDNGDIVSFHTAFQTKRRTPGSGSVVYSDAVIFFTAHDIWPSVTAQAYGLTYEFMRNATDSEVAIFLDHNDDIQIKRVIEK